MDSPFSEIFLKLPFFQLPAQWSVAVSAGGRLGRFDCEILGLVVAALPHRPVQGLSPGALQSAATEKTVQHRVAQFMTQQVI